MTRKIPDHLKLLRGNTGKRPIKPRGVEPRGDAQRPAHVVGYAAVVWDSVVATMPAGTYRATDEGILSAYCLSAATHRTATFRLMIEGEVITGPRGRQTRNPWLAVQRDAVRCIETLGRRLGLDPIAREHLPVPQPTASKFSGLISGDQDHESGFPVGNGRRDRQRRRWP